MVRKPPPFQWKAASLAILAIVLLALAPQIYLWGKRGDQWNGAYATQHGDEFLYSAYLNALIDGRERRNDPFLGTDLAKKPLPETTFSIQLVPAKSLTLIAQIFNLSASTTFIVLSVLAGLLAALSLYWLLFCLTGDGRLAATGILFVLCLGGAAAEQGLIGLLLNRDLLIFGLPFLRRYQPAASFFWFFIFAALVWQSLKSTSTRLTWVWTALAALTMAILVFSYLYLWTAALAWVGLLAMLYLLVGPAENRKRALGVFATIGAVTALALLPYWKLVSQRAHTLDAVQTMMATRRPDLFRLPEIIGLVVLVGLFVTLRKKKLQINDLRVLFCGTFALLPFIVFNQQVLTGRSMQPFHFEDFVVNYVSLVSLFLFVTLVWRPIPTRALVWISALSLLCGIVEVNLPMRAYGKADIVRDEAVPVMRRFNGLAPVDQDEPALVYSPRTEIMLTLPTWAPQGTLLGIGSLDFGSISQLERKLLFYAYLYYSNADGNRLRELFEGKTEDSFLKYYVRSVVFGHERVLPSLTSRFQPIEPHEIEQAIKDFEQYSQTFSRDQALKNPLNYLVTRSEDEGDLSRVDRWYQRSTAERVGQYNLYRLTLRN